VIIHDDDRENGWHEVVMGKEMLPMLRFLAVSDCLEGRRSTRRRVLAAVGGALASALLVLPLRGDLGPAAFQIFPDSGIVSGVSDGDSLRVRFSDGVERRVRLIGVDSPELDAPRSRDAFRALLAKRFTFFHLFRRAIRLEYDSEPLDVYGRVLAYVRTEDGELFNVLLIREGYARAFLRYPFRPAYRDCFKRAEAEAKRAGKGLWQNAEPELIPATEVRSHLGRLIRVRFVCSGIAERRGFLILDSAGHEFETLIPEARRRAFPRLSACVGGTLVVTGFLEEFGGRPQIMVSFPSQLERE
jgi:micrococcal nuclease